MISILHTSDWHLGLDMGGHSRLQEQSLFLDWLKEQCLQHKPNALLVSGDIYDTANPSVAAQSLLANFLVSLHTLLPNMSVILIGGNHDSAMRLEIPRTFAQALGSIHIVGSIEAKEPVSQHPAWLQKAVVPIYDTHAELIGVVLAVPFMRISDLNCKPKESQTVSQAYEQSLIQLYTHLQEYARNKYSGVPVIGMGHLTVAKSILAGSELSFIGGIESIDICALGNGLEYFALGHIHRGQKVAQEHWRYCGSPLSIDFDECKYNHHIILAQIPHAHSAAQVQKVEVPCFVPMLSIPERPATWEQVVSAFEQINWQQYGELPGDLYPFVKLKVQWEHELADLRGRVEQLCKNKPMRMIGSPIVEISAAGQDEDAQQSSDFSIDLTHASTPEMLMKKAWKKSYGVDCPEPIIGLFNEIVAQVKIGEKGS